MKEEVLLLVMGRGKVLNEDDLLKYTLASLGRIDFEDI